MSYLIGTDVGGTFTDLVILDDAGNITLRKTATTRTDPSLGVERVLAEGAAAMGCDLTEVLADTIGFAHGTTTATNAFIERKGVTTGLVTTRGFGDTLLVQRLMGMTSGIRRDELAHFSMRRYPTPLVPSKRIHEVDERIDARGREVVALDEVGLRRIAGILRQQDVASVAVCFLWSFLNPDHERRAGEILRQELPGANIVLSVDVAPVLGEYERTATTVVNAYLAPPVAEYLKRLEARLRRAGLTAPMTVLNSVGGVTAIPTVEDQVVSLLLSGPTAGVTASVELARSIDTPNVITTDMGGTSFDVGLIVDGAPLVQPVVEVGKYHLAMPMIAIESIGAGGGSIARVRDGYLSVGPESAGSDPGPACYARGGLEPTVTDADVVLGVLDPATFLGGRLVLDPERAAAAIERYVATPLTVDTIRAAAAIRHIADSHMGDLLRCVTLERGYDPADFVLFAYGGAGPAHCCAYASELGLTQILVPATAAAHSAFGAAVSDVSYSVERSTPFVTPPGFHRVSDHWAPSALQSRFIDLERICHRALVDAGVDVSRIAYHRTAEMRFRRQTNSISVAVPHEIDSATVDELADRFEEGYERRFGPNSGYREAGIELVTCRVRAVVQRRRPAVRAPRPGAASTPMGDRQVYHTEIEAFVRTPVYGGPGLAAGTTLAGPCIIQQPGTTILVAPDWQAHVDEQFNLRLVRGEDANW